MEILVLIFGIALGYIAGEMLKRYFSPDESDRNQ